MNPIGTNFDVRFMIEAARFGLIIGECTVSGKCGGFRGVPAITATPVNNWAAFMEKACPPWRKKNSAVLDLWNGYAVKRSLIPRNIWQSGNAFPKWSKYGKLV